MARQIPPGLYIVSTPIGNLGDVSRRALDVLAAADLVACEDTRVTRKLLAAHRISARLAAYHDHNAERALPGLIRRLKAGEIVALVSDAGTPLVSDPGYRLVRAAIADDIAVAAVPGPSAALAALVASGLPSDRFLFAGFLPPRDAARRAALEELAAVKATLIFFESPRRLAASLRAMTDILGDRPAAVARELTKRFEETSRGTLAHLAERAETAGPPKGEIVIVVGPPLAEAPDPADIDRRLAEALETGSVRDAAAAVAGETGVSRKTLYARALALRRSDGT